MSGDGRGIADGAASTRGPTATRATAVVGRAWLTVTTVLTLALSALLLGAAALLFFLHLSVQPVLTGSMRPTYAPGWAVVSRAIPVSAIRPGMVVIFVPPGQVGVLCPPGGDRVGPDRCSRIITTKGDANPAADPWHARIAAHSIQQVVGARARGWAT